MDAASNGDSWQERLYGAYVTSGQANVQAGNADRAFQPRAAFLRRLIRRHMPVGSGLSILDIGCGSGALIHFLSQDGYLKDRDGGRVIGVDVSPEQVALARSLGIDAVISGDLYTFLCASEDRKFDVVFALDVLEHFDRPQLFQILDQIRRVLKPGGSLILHVPNAEGIFGARIRFGDLTHEIAFTPSSISQVLRTCGFSNVECFEDTPIGSSFLTNAVRRAIWLFTKGLFRLIHAAETGNFSVILTQNMTAVAS